MRIFSFNISISVPDTHLAELRTTSGLFMSWGKTMGTKEHPTAMDIPAQIENLKASRLIITDEEEAARILQRISYYRLIKAYGPSFKDKETGIYHRDTTFSQIYQVYQFDNRLRHLLILPLQEIEITFRCQISNYFCVKYGPLGHLDPSNFDPAASFNELEAKINQCLSQSEQSPIIQHFQNEYIDGKVPLYAAVEVFTFGALAKFYSSMKLDDRKYIASLYENVNEHYLSSWLVSIGYVRNLCSHFNRLYRKTLIKPPTLYKKQERGIDNRRLFSVLCCMRYLLKGAPEWRAFVDDLEKLFAAYQDCVNPYAMGFITEWKNKLLDQEDLS